MRQIRYSEGILEAHHFLLKNYPEVFVIGQGLWSPWYVGATMKDLDVVYGRDRVMDTPVSEDGTTAIATGASLCGYRALVVHPRMDFMLLAVNSMVNQAAKWSLMLGGQAHPALTVRGIINRGGEQGAQHSQALHSWFAHIPGLRVVMPSTAADARDLLIGAVLSNDPVLYIDDRWCYDRTSVVSEPTAINLARQRPQRLSEGEDITLVGCGWTTGLLLDSLSLLEQQGVRAEVIDLRVLNPIDPTSIAESVAKTGRLLVVDGSWANCGMASEIVALASERLPLGAWKAKPQRITLPNVSAPSSRVCEEHYYPTTSKVVRAVAQLMDPELLEPTLLSGREVNFDTTSVISN